MDDEKRMDVIMRERAKFPMLFALAICFGEPLKGINAKVNSGTVALIKLNNTYLAVTCSHIIAEYRKKLERNNKVILQIGNLDIDLNEQLLNDNEEFDLATIKLKDEHVRIINTTPKGQPGSCFFEPVRWPPEELKSEDSIVFGGFPAKMCNQIRCNEFLFDSWSSGGCLVHNVNETEFSCQFEREKWKLNFGSDHMELDCLGGLSGGPAFIERKLHWEFIGIIYEHSPSFDIMFFRPAKLIHSNGIIGHI